MHQALVLGAGKIGSLVACLLADSGAYRVHLGDVTLDAPKRLVEDLALANVTPCALDVRRPTMLEEYLLGHQFDAVISNLPYFCNATVAQLARSHHLQYFDLTEDIEVTAQIKSLSSGADRAFLPQCGLAPGFISIVTHELMTWSTDGLINEYGNPCYGIEGGRVATLQPLEGYETIELDGLLYEAFNTSGGLGTLAETYAGRVRTMNYKTLRYPGHCEKIQLLMKDLKLNEDRETLKRILESAVPQTLQDVVLIYASVTGTRQGELFEDTYVKKIYPQKIHGRLWSAIQVTTASALCSVVDLVLNKPAAYQGFVTQETFPLANVIGNRFGACFR